MITFESRNNTIRQAELITKRAHNVYPHISPSRISQMVEKNDVRKFFFTDFLYNTALKFLPVRMKLEDYPKQIFTNIIESFKNIKLGNCSEEAKLAELIGKINGQKNIYSGSIFIKDSSTYEDKKLDHEIAFITNKKMSSSKPCELKAKEAIIIDPWLGITDYIGNYFNTLKTTYNGMFFTQPDEKEYVSKTKKFRNREGFKKLRKKLRPRSNFKILADNSTPLTQYKLKQMKKLHPELVINNYKKLEL